MKSSSRSSKRKKKQSQKRSKKRTRSSREKHKKLKQRDHSISCSDDENLISNLSVSCSSSGDDHRVKKRGMSRDRRRKKDKKRIKRSSLVSESSGDDSLCIKKRKKSKKNNGSGSRKKRHVKRRKRDRSVSSSRSRSRSCSGREPSDDSERECEREEEKGDLKERKGAEKGKERIGRKKSRRRSRSLSPCSLHSEDSSYYREERVLERNNPKRLKSIIVVTKEREVTEEELNRDERLEDEIVCDFDDYPSKSNESNDGVSGREATLYSHDVSSERWSLDEPYRESVASDVRALEVRGIQRSVVEGSGVVTSCYVRSRVDDPLMGNKSEFSTVSAGSNHDDLEAILRQKALANLLKRQGKLPTKISADKKDDCDIEVKESSIVKAQPLQLMTCDEENIISVRKVDKVDEVRYATNLPGPLEDTGLSKDNDAHIRSSKVELVHLEDKGKAPCDFPISRPSVGLSTVRSFGSTNTWKRQLIPQDSSLKNLSAQTAPREVILKDSKQQLTSREYCQPKLSAPQEAISNHSTGEIASQRSDTEVSTEKVVAVAVSEPSASGEQNMKDKINEIKEEAHFQQKTMSVIRGGELVQVSYKVYIPKKAPALARRQLKR